MKSIFALILLATAAQAFPPAPDFTYYGVVRDEAGRPLDTSEGTVIVSGPTAEITRTVTQSDRGVGTNYSVHIPLDAASTNTLYQVNALRPAMPFTMKVVIRGINYVPIQMNGKTWVAGTPGGRERLDLTLGVDTDNDGLPDSWEQGLIDGDNTGLVLTLADITAVGDLDKDGLSNLAEYQLGTYALDSISGLSLEIAEVVNGKARLEFACVAGRTYSITASTDLRTWKAEDFALTATAEPQPSLRATDTGVLSVWVPVKDRQKLLFRLAGQ